MSFKLVSAGPNPPHEIHVVIEIPRGSEPVKYEVDKDTGALFVDRFLHTAMFYPCNYGYVPRTLAADGDPVDVLLITESPVISGAVVRARPIGVLHMEDEEGDDAKILALPVNALYPFHRDVHTYSDLPKLLLQQIVHFFEHYKDLEEGKWASVHRWEGPDEALASIRTAIETYEATEAATASTP